MVETIQIQFAAILGLSAVCQWLGWRFKIPSILILLTGFLIGPVFNLIDVYALFGDLPPLVSASVAILLFEGGLTLRMKDLRHDGSVIFRLVTIGVVVTFALATWFSVELLGFDLKTAALFGALLSLTGPTVIGPVLRTVRPKGSVKHIAKWEGILNDPIAVLLAVFVFELAFLNPAHPSEQAFWTHLAFGILKTSVVAGLCAWGGARLMIYLIRHRMLPEFLHNLMIMAIVIVTFVFSNYVQEEAGLRNGDAFRNDLGKSAQFPSRSYPSFQRKLGRFDHLWGVHRACGKCRPRRPISSDLEEFCICRTADFRGAPACRSVLNIGLKPALESAYTADVFGPARNSRRRTHVCFRVKLTSLEIPRA